MTTDAQPNGEAEYLLNHPLLAEILSDLEQDAVEQGVNAPADDDQTRRTAMERVRVIRDLRQELRDLAEGSAANLDGNTGVV